MNKRSSRYTKLVGEQLNKLTIKSISPERGKRGRTLLVCECECGSIKNIVAEDVASGHTKSCGCYGRQYHITHGLSQYRIYNIWGGMIRRCYDPNDKDYKDYGERGIKVCSEWKESCKNLLSDMGHPLPGLELDRINNNGNYEKSNCKWSTPTENKRNKRTNRLLTVNEQTKTLAEWIEITGIAQSTILNRLQRGLSHFDALTIPVGNTGPSSSKKKQKTLTNNILCT